MRCSNARPNCSPFGNGILNVEEIELGCLADDLARLAPLEGFHEVPEQRIDENLVILLDGLGVDAAVARDVRVVDEFAV